MADSALNEGLACAPGGTWSVAENAVAAVTATRRKSKASLDRSSKRFHLVCAHELIPLHGDRDLVRTFNGVGVLPAAQYFTEATDTHRRIAAGKRNEIFDASANFNGGRRKEGDATRTDVLGKLDTVDPLITQMEDVQRKLQAVSLCASLFQLSTLTLQYNLINRYRYRYSGRQWLVFGRKRIREGG